MPRPARFLLALVAAAGVAAAGTLAPADPGGPPFQPLQCEHGSSIQNPMFASFWADEPIWHGGVWEAGISISAHTLTCTEELLIGDCLWCLDWTILSCNPDQSPDGCDWVQWNGSGNRGTVQGKQECESTGYAIEKVVYPTNPPYWPPDVRFRLLLKLYEGNCYSTTIYETYIAEFRTPDFP